MNEQERITLVELLEDQQRRRCWLLYKALENLPLDRAIDLARAAEAFVTGLSAQHLSDAPAHPEPAALSSHAGEEQPHSPMVDNLSNLARPIAQKRSRLALPPRQRELLLDRIARGGKNAEVAAEYGLSPKQVHGIRMGSAREIAKRREYLSETERPDQGACAVPASVDEIVRYLRQQDDVVVPQGDGEFLVNARFRLQFDELVARANRMRTRQRKPEFASGGSPAAREEAVAPANGH